MTDFDEKLRQMATAEDTPVPDGFDARLTDTLAALPGGARRLRRGLKTALIAACLCAAVVGTSLAVSPSLREYLANLWGIFLPYTQEIEDVTYVSDGIEVKVISAMADGTMAKVYIQARDLDGDRLYYGMGSSCSLRRKGHPSGPSKPSVSGSCRCVAFDEETGIALIEVYAWGPYSSGAADMELFIGGFSPEEDGEPSFGGGYTIPLQLELLERRAFQVHTRLTAVDLDGTQLDDVVMESFEISPIGLAAAGSSGSDYRHISICVHLEDGTVRSANFAHSNATSYADGTVFEWGAYWDFPEPLDDIDAVTGVTFGTWYLPIYQDGTVGEGHQLSG